MPYGDGAELKILVEGHLLLPRCPHCATAHPTIKQEHFLAVRPLRGMPQAANQAQSLRWHIYICTSCGGLIAAMVPVTTHQQPMTKYATWIIPGPRAARTDVPPRVAGYLDQAQETMSSPSASVMVSASAVDAMLKEKGYKTGSLYTRIGEAVAANVITADMGEWAHDVRLDANDERHADEQSALPTVDDAIRCYEFAVTLAEVIFVLPARVKRGRKQTPAQT